MTIDKNRVDLEFHRGDTFCFYFQLLDNENKPINFDEGNKELYFTFKNNFNTTDFIFQKKFTDDDNIKFDGTYIYITIDPEDTEELEYKNDGYVYDVEYDDADFHNFVKTVLYGSVKLKKEATFADNK